LNFGAPYGAPECEEKLDNLTKRREFLRKGYKSKKASFQYMEKSFSLAITASTVPQPHIPTSWDTTQLRYDAKKKP